MSAPIVLPPILPPVFELEVAPGGAPPTCDRVTTSVRAAAVGLAEVTAETSSRGLPVAWEGGSAEQAGAALGAFGRDADAVTAALETATRVFDVYDGQVVELANRRDLLDADRVDLNRDIDALRTRITAAGAAADGGAGQEAQLRHEAQVLTERHRAHRQAVVELQRDVTAAEDRVIAALRSVDTYAEGESAADDPARPSLPALVAGLRRVADDPEAVNVWWLGLTGRQREALKIHRPDLVGGLGGIPARDRDDVNRAVLEREIDYLNGLGDLTDEEQRRLDNALAVQDALAVKDDVTDLTTGDPVRPLLLLFDGDAFGGDGSAAVSIGDPDTADNTAVTVPGFGNDLTTIGGKSEEARRIYEAAAESGETPAVITWFGYDAPSIDPGLGLDDVLGLVNPFGDQDVDELVDTLGVADESKAEAGGDALVEFVDGLRASDEGDRSHLSLLGHSYGSTTAALGADAGADVDDLVLTGSPGAGDGNHHVTDLGLTSDHVFVAAAENDPITWLGGDGDLGLGPDPSQESFGGTRIDAWNGRDIDLGDGVTETIDDNHNSYYDDRSRSLDNIAAVVNGDDPETVAGRDRPAREYLESWAHDEAGDQVDRLKDKAVDELADGIVRGGRLLDAVIP